MDNFTFLAVSSSGNPYDVLIRINSNSAISIVCSCPAGSLSQFCKHARAFIEGDSTILHDSSHLESFDGLQNFIKKTQTLVDSFNAYESELKQIDARKKELDKEKSQLKGMFARKLQEGI